MHSGKMCIRHFFRYVQLVQNIVQNRFVIKLTMFLLMSVFIISSFSVPPRPRAPKEIVHDIKKAEWYWGALINDAYQ